MIEIQHKAELIERKLFSERNRPIDTIIIHGISNPDAGNDRFKIQSIIDVMIRYNSSAHYAIGREEEEMGQIYEFISPTKKAWHAGRSEFRGQKDLNQNAIGIEMIGDWESDYLYMQYTALVNLSAYLFERFPLLTVENIKGHQIVSDSSVRADPKPDPGRYFNWIRFGYDLINELKRRGIYR